MRLIFIWVQFYYTLPDVHFWLSEIISSTACCRNHLQSFFQWNDRIAWNKDNHTLNIEGLLHLLFLQTLYVQVWLNIYKDTHTRGHTRIYIYIYICVSILNYFIHKIWRSPVNFFRVFLILSKDNRMEINL